MQKSRFIYLHAEANAAKVAALEELQVEYSKYLELCVNLMIDSRKMSVDLRDRRTFFPNPAYTSQERYDPLQQCGFKEKTGNKFRHPCPK